MTIGVSFDSYHSRRDLGMILTDVDLGLPEVQTNYVDIPGRDGQLDLTTALTGAVQYKNRTISMTFQTTPQLCGRSSWQAWLSEVSTLLHGQERRITFDGDDGHYTGRCTVGSFTRDGGLMTISVSCNCAPYKTSAADNTTKNL